MSEDNVEIVRRAYEAFNRGDLDGMVADFAPEFEYVASGAVPGTRGVHPGTEGFRQYTEGFWGEFDDAHIEVHELTEARDQVLASVTFRGRGKQSGVEASWDIWQLWTLRDGKNVRGEGFPSRDEALKAAGLSE
jgi:uncharacterized protein